MLNFNEVWWFFCFTSKSFKARHPITRREVQTNKIPGAPFFPHLSALFPVVLPHLPNLYPSKTGNW